ncbi:hypothetical protein [Nostoc sp.]|uniref:hypothetical protein n=1 Tax=Nostoc sp. TaxID=1180 RepID=UPI002FF59D5B
MPYLPASYDNIPWVQVWVLMVQGAITVACKCYWALLDHLCVYRSAVIPLPQRFVGRGITAVKNETPSDQN